MNAERIAMEAYRLRDQRGIVPDEVFRAVLGDGDVTDPEYRRAYRMLADAWVQVAWPRLDRDGHLCGHCRTVLPDGAERYCGPSCERRHIEGRTGARRAA